MIDDEDRLLEVAFECAVIAGKKSLEYHGREIPVERKADHSPLTLADTETHRVIVEALRERSPELPILSEESPAEEVADRQSWDTFWMVDPLDGSKEFLKRTGEFTVNVALIVGSEPILGVVHVPVSGVTYLGRLPSTTRRGAAWVDRGDGQRRPIHSRRARLDRLTVVASKDHAGPLVEAFISGLVGAEVTSMGSSLKFCLVAEGVADFYPRVVPTMEWDTAAAQCIVEAAGGRVTNLEGERLAYNKNDLRNPSLMTFGDVGIDWTRIFPG